MTLTLEVDGPRWRAHLRAVALSTPGLVPVAKGNGYGFGLGSLARRADWLDRELRRANPPSESPGGAAGIDTLAVGTYHELDQLASRFAGSLLVLTPWRPGAEAAAALDSVNDSLNDRAMADRVIHTVGRLEDLALLRERHPRPWVVLERRTSMRRHGFAADELVEAARDLSGVRLAGVSLHLPLAPARSGSHLPEVHALLGDIAAAGLIRDPAGNRAGHPARATAPTPLFVSHLADDELASLRSDRPDLAIRPRIGTSLWLGDRAALRVRSTVLDRHPVKRGETFGYRGRTAPGPGHLLVAGGGTAHGIGLESPTGDLSLKARAASIARGGLDAAGVARSPFTLDGKRLRFAEPPHMQASMLFVPDGARVPEIGDQLEVRVRFTATTFDRVVIT
ncbi:MAG: alanine racemase [Nocardioides sp.]